MNTGLFSSALLASEKKLTCLLLGSFDTLRSLLWVSFAKETYSFAKGETYKRN